MRESAVETHLRLAVKRAGGLYDKFKSPGRHGVPDRLVTLPGSMDLVELKRPGGKAEDHQKRDHARRFKLGIRVRIIDTIEAADAYIQERTNGLFQPVCVCSTRVRARLLHRDNATKR